MKSWLERSSSLLVVFCIFCLLGGPVIAESDGLDIAPQSIMIATDNGGNADTGITVLNLAEDPRDFTVVFSRSAETDTTKSLEPRYLSFPGDPVSLSSMESRDIPVSVTTSEMEAGEYQGSLRVITNATVTSIPVDVKVRDPLLWKPIFWLGLSTALSVLFFVFGPSWRKRTVLKRDSALYRSKVIADNELDTNEFARYFRQNIMTTLDDADGKILRNDYSEAETALQNVKKYWDWWYVNRMKWLIHLKDSVEMMKNIQDTEGEFGKFTGGNCTCFAELREGYRKFWGDVVFPTTNNNVNFSPLLDLHKKLPPIETILPDLQKAWVFCDSISDPKKREECSRGLQKFGQTLRTKSLPEMIVPSSILKALEEVLKPYKGMAAAGWAGPAPDAAVVSRIPVRRSEETMSPGKEADLLTKILNLAEIISTTFVPIGVLIVIGVITLYYNNLTFGSVIDYLGLILWGFLSCAINEGIWEKVTSLKPTKSTQI